jgi:hypothetical protein
MPQRRYKQLKLSIEPYREEFIKLWLSFKLGKHTVQGILSGARNDWYFQSSSPAFLKQIPGGVLPKYALWYNRVPKNITSIYNNIMEAALREGYDLMEKEEVAF